MGGWYMSSAKVPTYLIVCFRYIGDVLVTTPLALSIKTAQPEAVIDYLVFQGTEAVLAKNPHIRTVHTIPPKKASISKLLSLYRRYDVAIAAGTSDRTVVFSSIIGRRRFGLDYGYPRDFWKRLLLWHYVRYDDSRHVVWNMLAILEPLGIPSVPRIAIGFDQDDLLFSTRRIPVGPFVVMHPYSRNSCKYWPVKKWRELACMVAEKLHVKVLFTRTPDSEDLKQLHEIMHNTPSGVVNLSDVFSLNQMAAALTKAKAYIGIDTVITHIAATVGVPTIALFGPTWTKYWAPWPNGCDNISPFAKNKGIQKEANVTVVQKGWDCVPCNKEHCAISLRNKMECLEELSVEEVYESLRVCMRLEEE